MSPPGFLQVQMDEVLMRIKVQPRAARNEIGAIAGEQLKVRVTAPPVDSAANQALLRFLSEVLDCPVSAVRLIRGHTSRHKLVAVSGISAAKVLACLTAWRRQ